MAGQTLLISVRFHEGRYHGRGDWPPAPGRLFQALVAAAARGASIPDEDEVALRWLETLPPPLIAAPTAAAGQSVTSYVPNNDLDAKGGDPAAVAELRVGKVRTPLLFDERLPVLYAWRLAEHAPEAVGLVVVARRLHRLGQGVDMASATAELFEDGEADAVLTHHPGRLHRPCGPGDVPCARKGTFESLRARHEALLGRLDTRRQGRRTITVFAQPPRAMFDKVGYDAPPAVRHYELRTPTGDFAAPSLASMAQLVEHVRNAAALRLSSAAPAAAGHVSRFLEGRGAGPGDRDLRVRLLPLPSIGHEHASPALRRLRVETPSGCPLAAEDVFWAVGGVLGHDDDGGVSWELRQASDDAMARRYLGPARIWRSITPLALGALGRARGSRIEQETQARRAVAQALRHVGVRARAETVRVQREPFDPRGRRAEDFVHPRRFAPHVLWHAEVRLDAAVPGPLVLGDGRFVGLGLMRPEGAREAALALAIGTPLPEDADPEALSVALRRAVMGTWKGRWGPDDLPEFLTGHEDNGDPLRSGERKHIAYHCDLFERRFLFMLPPGLSSRRIGLLEAVLASMREVRAGSSGILSVRRVPVEPEDAMLAPSRIWESAGPWRPMRHRKTGSAEGDVKADILAEHRLRGWPAPEHVRILRIGRDQQGMHARLRLTYAVAPRGPIMLGRSAMKGGGLFRAVQG